MNEPLRIIIVDDEPYVRKKIRGFALAERGFRIVGEADNGVAALELAQRVRPHIVVADIGMPVMNGLELLRRLREQRFPPEVLMLTCFEQFEKVQTALRYGAADYVTKLLFKEADFLDALERLKGKVREAERYRRQTAREWLYACASQPADTLPPVLERLADGMRMGCALVAVLRAAPDSADWLAERSAELADRDATDGRPAPFPIRLDRDAWAYVYYRHVRCANESLASEAETSLKEFLGGVPPGRKVRAFVSEAFYDWARLSEKVHEALAASDDALGLPTNAVIRVCEAAPGGGDVESLAAAPPPTEEELSRLPGMEAADVLRRWLRSLDERRPSYAWREVRCALPRLLCACVRREGGPPIECFAEANERLRDAFDVPGLIETVDRLLDEWGGGEFPAGADAGTRSEIRKAVDIIHRRYDQEISLHSIAKSVNLSSSWFASLFRAELGKPFTEYVQQYRLQQAKRLLRETDMKVYEVAGAVGIPNARYFSRMFYEAFGMTPLEYKKGRAG